MTALTLISDFMRPGATGASERLQMNSTHYNLVRIERSAVIEVTLRGSAANESPSLTDRQCDIHRQQALAMSQPFGRDKVEMSGGAN